MADITSQTYDPSDYAWMHDYVWSKLEPALSELGETVHERDGSVTVTVESEKSPNYPFSGAVYFEKKTLWVIVQKDLLLYFDCGPWLASWPEAHQLACYSNVSTDESRRIVANGPIVMLDLNDQVQMRQEVDAWIRVTLSFIDQSTSLILHELGSTR